MDGSAVVGLMVVVLAEIVDRDSSDRLSVLK